MRRHLGVTLPLGHQAKTALWANKKSRGTTEEKRNKPARDRCPKAYVGWKLGHTRPRPHRHQAWPQGTASTQAHTAPNPANRLGHTERLPLKHMRPPTPPPSLATQNGFHPVTARELQPLAGGHSVITKRGAFMRISKGHAAVPGLPTSYKARPGKGHVPASLPTHPPRNHHFILSLSCYCIIISYLPGSLEQGRVCINKYLCEYFLETTSSLN